MTTPAAAAAARRKFRPAPISVGVSGEAVLVSRYPLDGGAVTDTLAGVNGTITGTWTSTTTNSLVSGVSGQSFFKDGNNAYFTIPANNPLHNLGALSFSLYFQPSSDAAAMTICARANSTTIGGFSLERRPDGRLRGWHVGPDGGLRFFGNDANGIPGTNLVVGTAYRITVTMGPSGLKIYLNDSQVDHITQNTNSWVNSSAWFFGIFTNAVNGPMRGAIDFIRVWSGELQASAVAGLEDATSITTPTGEQGIAAGFPGDAGIASHPSVVWHENWEDGNTTGWNVFNDSTGSTVINTNLTNVHSGTRSLEWIIGQSSGDSGGTLTRVLTSGLAKMHVRWYVKYEAAWNNAPNFQSHTGTSIRGCGPNGCTAAGVQADGVNKFSVSFEPTQSPTSPFTTAQFAAPGRMYLYVYHMDAPGNFGELFAPNINSAAAQLSLDTWHCCEVMVQVNTPGTANGEIKGWVDGVQILHQIGMRLRSTSALLATENRFSFFHHENSTRTNRMWIDDIVFATEYIGPMT